MFAKQIPRSAVFSAEKMAKVDLLRARQLSAGLNCLEPGQEHAPHTHAGQDKLYLVLEGAGVATVGDESRAVSAGDLILAPEGVLHSLANPGPDRLTVLVVFAPPPPEKVHQAVHQAV
jgi:quercetin dioxygenase-like cupin family protein